LGGLLDDSKFEVVCPGESRGVRAGFVYNSINKDTSVTSGQRVDNEPWSHQIFMLWVYGKTADGSPVRNAGSPTLSVLDFVEFDADDYQKVESWVKTQQKNPPEYNWVQDCDWWARQAMSFVRTNTRLRG
jgi:hypothetical protein